MKWSTYLAPLSKLYGLGGSEGDLNEHPRASTFAEHISEASSPCLTVISSWF